MLKSYNLRDPIVEVPETAFNLITVLDNKLLPDEDLVLFVHNSEEFVEWRMRNDPFSDPKILNGKPEGFGMAGGGVDKEDYEKSLEAAIRESAAETGLELVKSPKLIKEIHKIILYNKYGKTLRPYIIVPDKHLYFPTRGNKIGNLKKICSEHDIHTYSVFKVVYNTVYIYRSDVSWDKSPHQKIFHNLMNECLLSHSLEEFIENVRINGIFFMFDDLTKEEEESLKIFERKEINGLGLFPASVLQRRLNLITRKLTMKNGLINLESELNPDKNDMLLPYRFYKMHLEAILSILSDKKAA